MKRALLIWAITALLGCGGPPADPGVRYNVLYARRDGVPVLPEGVNPKDAKPVRELTYREEVHDATCTRSKCSFMDGGERGLSLSIPTAVGRRLSPPIPTRGQMSSSDTGWPCSLSARTQASTWAALLSRRVPSTSRMTPRYLELLISFAMAGEDGSKMRTTPSDVC